MVESTPVGEGTKMKFGVRAEVLSSPELDHDKLTTKKTLRVLVVDDVVTNRKCINRKLKILEESMSFTI